MSKLFSKYKIKDLDLKNRIVMAPMCTNSAVDGYSNDWHVVHYGTRAVGGVGLIILEATGIEKKGLICEDDLGIWDDSHIEGLKKIVDFCHQNGSKIGIQLGHAGRKCELNEEDIIAPSAIRFSEEYKMPREMTKEDIKDVINKFKEGTIRALKAGFDTIEIHGAHGYLISQFLSPITNRREDEYGGSIENRSRFLIEVIKEVKAVWPKEKPIILRVSAYDYLENGNDEYDLAKIIKLVKNEGIDIVNVSSGGVAPARIEPFAGYQIKFCEVIKNEAKIPTIGGGMITSPLMAEEILRNDRADLVYFGRELLRNPYFPIISSSELDEEIDIPIQYERAFKVRKGGF